MNDMAQVTVGYSYSHGGTNLESLTTSLMVTVICYIVPRLGQI